jgi:hypothetical protein
MLTQCNALTYYVEAVLDDERASLNLQHIYNFFLNFFPRVSTCMMLP